MPANHEQENSSGLLFEVLKRLINFHSVGIQVFTDEQQTQFGEGTTKIIDQINNLNLKVPQKLDVVRFAVALADLKMLVKNPKSEADNQAEQYRTLLSKFSHVRQLLAEYGLRDENYLRLLE